MKRAIGSVLVGYGLWGLLPMFWKQFHTLDAVYLLAVRIVMSMVFCLLLVAVTRRFDALRAEGYGDMITETVNANSLSSFVKEQIAENGDELPSWLHGLVNVFEKTTVGVRKAR